MKGYDVGARKGAGNGARKAGGARMEGVRQSGWREVGEEGGRDRGRL